ncbi:hypothetical protein Tco_0762712 [Tanacetum coccineum]
MKGKSVETKFDKSSIIRQPNAFKCNKQSLLGKPTTFLDSPAKKEFSKSKLITINNVSSNLSKQVTAQILPQKENQVEKNTNVIAPRMYKVHTRPNQTKTTQLPQDIRKTNKYVSFSTGVIPTTSVSRPQLKSNQLEDRVLHNNSQGKKQEVEDNRRIFKFPNNKTTKKPIVVPISTREPKRTVNQFAATHLNKIVTSEPTNQKPKSNTRNQYEHVSKICRWWYSKTIPPGYKWKSKSSTINVKHNVSLTLGIKSRTTNILELMTLRKPTLFNTPLPSNSFAARSDNSVHHQIWVLKAHDGKSQASK